MISVHGEQQEKISKYIDTLIIACYTIYSK